MDADKTTTKIKINNKQSTSTDFNNDINEYNSEMANLRFKKHLDLLKLKVKVINDKPSTMEQLYGYFQIPIVAAIFLWLL